MPLPAFLLLALLPQSSYPDLVERLADPAWMMTMPVAGEAVLERIWEPGDTERAWELAGPGVVASVWADPPAGVLEFFRPGEDQAVLRWDLAAAAAGGGPGFPAPLAERVGSGWSSVVPVPFRSGLRLVHRPDPAQPARIAVAVRVQDEPGALPALAADLFDAAGMRAVRRAAERLARGALAEVDATGFKAGTVSFHDNAQPGVAPDAGEFQWGFRGHGVVRWFTLRFLPNGLPRPLEETMRALVLRVEIGSHERMHEGELLFEVPLGDFLGCAADPLAATGAFADYDPASGEFRFRLPIAYQDGMKIVLRGAYREATRVRLDAGVDVYEDPATLPPLTLHAGWVGGRGAALPVWRADGPVRLVGYTCASLGSSTAPLDWRGPSAFAAAADRARPGVFRVRPVDDGPGGWGREVVTRWFAYDAPVAAAGLEFDPGIAFADPTMTWGALAWWYAPRGTAATWGGPASWPERRPGPLPQDGLARVASALEGEALRVTTLAAGSREAARSDGVGWSSGRWQWWSGGAPDAQCNLQFPVESAGEYRLHVQFATGLGFGAVQVLVDGRPLGAPQDCGGEGLSPSGEVSLGVLRLLPRADHVLSLRTLDGTAVGLDYLRLEPHPAGDGPRR